MIRYLLPLLLLTVTCACADNLGDRLGAALIGAPNDGPVFGAAISYQVYSHLWADVGVKREEGDTNPFVGASTDLAYVASMIADLLNTTWSNVPSGARFGGGYDLRRDEAFAYFAQSISF